MRRLVAPALAVATAIALAACGADGDDSGAPVPFLAPATVPTTVPTTEPATNGPVTTVLAGTVTTSTAPAVVADAHYELVDFGFTGPAELPVGDVHLTITNGGQQFHHLTVAKLREGVTYDQLAEQAAGGDAIAVDAMVVPYGGVNALDPGATATADIHLDESGDYVLLCFLSDEHDGKSHLQHGMIRPVTVVEQATVASTVETSDALLVMRDFGYDFDAAEIAAADRIEVENHGTQNHEAIVVRLDEGKGEGDLLGYFAKLGAGQLTDADVAPGHAIGGIAAIAPGGSAVMGGDLAPGHYAVLCGIPDTTNANTPHVLEGMYAEFDVTAP